MKENIQANKSVFRFNQLVVLLVLSVLLLIQSNVLAQTPEFPIGTFHRMEKSIQGNFTKLNEFGFNSVIQYGNANTLDWANVDNFLAENADNSSDVINHYTCGYYTKWEAEKTQSSDEITGLLHSAGTNTQLNGINCWSTNGLNSIKDSIIYGPHYYQEKNYRLPYNTARIGYTVRFRMAINDNNPILNPDDNVCIIRVIYRYAEIFPDGSDTTVNEVLAERVVKASEFRPDNQFGDIDLGYFYPNAFADNPLDRKVEPLENTGDRVILDRLPNTGIQFQVKWLGGNDNLYIDYIEVFDQNIWGYLIDPLNHNTEIQRIKNYASQYSNQTKLKYWYGRDEPNTMDSFTPMHIVDSLIRLATDNARFLITEYYPDWRIQVNGDNFMEKYYNMVKPQRLMIDLYPIQVPIDPPLWVRLESLRK